MNIIDSVRDMLKPTPPKPDRNMLEQVCATYKLAGRMFSEKLELGGKECVVALLRICDEQDPLVQEKLGGSVDAEVLTRVEASVLKLTVRYERKTSREYERVVQLHLKDATAQGRTITHRENLAWDHLPADVREDRILHDKESTEFQLYPHS